MSVTILWGSLRRAVSNIAKHEVGESAAALTYYLLFAMFPMLIFVSNLLGSLALNIDAITRTLTPVMPNEVVYLLETYLNYVQEESSGVLFWFSLVFSVWFPFRAVRSLTKDVRRAYQLGQPEKPLRHCFCQVVFTVAFLLFITVSLVLSVFGRRFITTISNWFHLGSYYTLPPFFLQLWQYLRFLLVGALMFLILGILYTVAQDKRCSVKAQMPGILIAMVLWLVASIGFSLYVENFGKYSVVYGALGTVIVLLLWLYMTSFAMILGAEINAAVLDAKKSFAK